MYKKKLDIDCMDNNVNTIFSFNFYSIFSVLRTLNLIYICHLYLLRKWMFWNIWFIDDTFVCNLNKIKFSINIYFFNSFFNIILRFFTISRMLQLQTPKICHLDVALLLHEAPRRLCRLSTLSAPLLLRYSWSGGSENAARRICCQIILPTGPWKISPGAIIVPLRVRI